MLKKLELGDDATWKKRFLASYIRWTKMADQNQRRGLVGTNLDGIQQLYAWDVESGELEKRTDAPAGITSGMISADGRYIYYHRDKQGDEIGHFVRIPFEGGEEEDVTPDMVPYSSNTISQSHAGNRIGFTGAEKEGFGIYLLDEGRSPRLLKQYERFTFGPQLSSDGAIAVIASSERSGSLDLSLEAFDAASGDLMAELWDGEDTSVRPFAFSPQPRDDRLLVTTSRTGFERPAIWNPRTEDRIDLPVDEISGTLLPSCWSPDAKMILLTGLHQAEYQLYRYDLEAERVVRLDHPPGVVSTAYFTKTGEIFTTWEAPSTPSRLIALDAQTGKQKRVVLPADESPPGRPWRSITFSSEDDTPIQAWLAYQRASPRSQRSSIPTVALRR